MAIQPVLDTNKDAALAAKRAKAEARIYEFLDTIEGQKNGYNSSRYRKLFASMSMTQFTAYMRRMKDDEAFNLFFEINQSSETGRPSIKRIHEIGTKYGVPLEEYVVFPHKNPTDPTNPMVTCTPIPVLRIPVRRLQQMADKKNSASSDINQINQYTGQVTGDAKSASFNDTQTASILTTGEETVAREFLSFRSDDQVSKKAAYRAIEMSGTVKMSDLSIKTKNKRSLRYVEVCIRGAGLKSNLMTDDEMLESDTD